MSIKTIICNEINDVLLVWQNNRSKKRKKERKDDVFESEAHLRAWLDGCLDEPTVADVTSLHLHNGETINRRNKDKAKLSSAKATVVTVELCKDLRFFSPSVLFKFLWLLKAVVRSSLIAWLQCIATLSISCVVFVELWRSIGWLTLRSTVVVLRLCCEDEQ